jgi:O-succinylbenzoic acid--CoA ligase
VTRSPGAIDPDGLSVLRAAHDSPDRIAVIAGAEVVTFAELAGPVARAARALSARGLAPGARVALSAQNRFATLIAIYALLELGVPFVPIHPRLTPGEAAVILEDAEPALVLDEAMIAQIIEPAIAQIIEPAIAQGIDPVHQRADRPAASNQPDELFADFSAPDPRGVLAVLYTSGTTGRPKGAILPRSAFVASAAASAANLGWREDDRWLLCMPLCHTGGLSIVTRCLLARRCVILGGDRAHPPGSPTKGASRFDPAGVLDTIARARATILSVVPTMLKALLAEDAAGVLERLRVVLVGGAAAPPSLLEDCARRGVRALTTYGLTETCSQVTAQRPLPESSSSTPPGRAPTVRHGAGAPLPGIAIAVRGEDGAPCPPGSPGRIHVCGPTLMAGYLHGPPLEGWFDTGDMGMLDVAGELHIHTRRTDLIVTGGENVYPAEVEQTIEACEGVTRALVFGVPDEVWGQIVAAAIVLDPKKPASPAAILHAVTVELAPHKRPRRVCFPDSLPLVTADKVDRREGSRRFASELVVWG